jgi:hypothetical protein
MLPAAIEKDAVLAPAGTVTEAAAVMSVPAGMMVTAVGVAGEALRVTVQPVVCPEVNELREHRRPLTVTGEAMVTVPPPWLEIGSGAEVAEAANALATLMAPAPVGCCATVAETTAKTPFRIGVVSP